MEKKRYKMILTTVRYYEDLDTMQETFLSLAFSKDVPTAKELASKHSNEEYVVDEYGNTKTYIKVIPCSGFIKRCISPSRIKHDGDTRYGDDTGETTDDDILFDRKGV